MRHQRQPAGLQRYGAILRVRATDAHRLNQQWLVSDDDDKAGNGAFSRTVARIASDFVTYSRVTTVTLTARRRGRSRPAGLQQRGIEIGRDQLTLPLQSLHRARLYRGSVNRWS